MVQWVNQKSHGFKMEVLNNKERLLYVKMIFMRTTRKKGSWNRTVRKHLKCSSVYLLGAKSWVNQRGGVAILSKHFCLRVQKDFVGRPFVFENMFFFTEQNIKIVIKLKVHWAVMERSVGTTQWSRKKIKVTEKETWRHNRLFPWMW